MNNNLQQRTLQALAPLVGMPMWACGRSVNLVWFQFGSKRIVSDKRGSREVGDFALHVQCFWRIYSTTEVIIASGDLLYPKGDPYLENESFDWTLPETNRFDERLKLIVDRTDFPFSVRSVKADRHGGFLLRLTSSVSLEVLPDATVDDEKWRLFQPYKEEPHFVI